jgi:hypothetical protein
MNRKRVAVVSAVLLTLALAIGGAGAALANDAGNGRVFPPSSEPRGRSYPEWFSAYMIWFQEVPAPVNPFVDPASARNCEVHGPAVFLGAAGADCRVPEDKILVFSSVGWECSTAEGLGETFRALRRCAVENFARDWGPDAVSLRLWIDGRRVSQPRRWTFVTPGEVVDFPRNNIWGVAAGPSKSVTKGFFYALRPFDEGRHRIRFRVVAPDGGIFDIVWRLRVVD